MWKVNYSISCSKREKDEEQSWAQPLCSLKNHTKRSICTPVCKNDYTWKIDIMRILSPKWSNCLKKKKVFIWQTITRRNNCDPILTAMQGSDDTAWPLAYKAGVVLLLHTPILCAQQEMGHIVLACHEPCAQMFCLLQYLGGGAEGVTSMYCQAQKENPPEFTSLTFCSNFCTSVKGDDGRWSLNARFVPQKKHKAKNCPLGYMGEKN